MGRESNGKKNRECKVCGYGIYGDSSDIKKHAYICGFERRTGLSVISAGKGFTISRAEAEAS